MKRILASTTVLFIAISSVAQNLGTIDSLKKQLSLATADSSTLHTYLFLAGSYLWTDNDSAIFYGYKALHLAEKLGDKLNAVRSRIPIFTAEGLKRNDAFAIKIMYETQRLAEQYSNERSAADWQLVKQYVQRQSGFLYNTMGDYRRSLQTHFRLASSREDYWKTDSLGLAFIIGQNYYELNVLDSALLFVNKSLEEYKEAGADWEFLHILLGNTYRKMKRYDVALAELHKALSMFNPGLDVGIDLSKVNIGLSQTFYETGKLDSALYYARAAMSSPNFNTFPDQQLQAFTLLKDIYKTKDNRDSAYKYTALALTLSDSTNNAEKIRIIQRTELEQQMNEVNAENEKVALQNRTKVYALVAALTIFLLVCVLLVRNNRQKQKANALLQKQNEEIERQKRNVEATLQELKATQSQLIQQEKMASLGELTAGIAHEIQNPLNFVNNFSEATKELADELQEELEAGHANEVKSLATDIRNNSEKVLHHGRRADSIVKNMLQHSKGHSGEKQAADLNALVEEYLRLGFHAYRSKDNDFRPMLNTFFDERIGAVKVVPQEIGRVLLNLYNNAFYAVHQKKQQLNGTYEPVISVTTKRENNNIQIVVKDNGTGMPPKTIEKVFQPFFTTKPTGVGTGLGLSLSYDIIKAHGGELNVESKENEGSTFIISLPFVN